MTVTRIKTGADVAQERQPAGHPHTRATHHPELRLGRRHLFFFFNDAAPTEISPLPLPAAFRIAPNRRAAARSGSSSHPQRRRAAPAPSRIPGRNALGIPSPRAPPRSPSSDSTNVPLPPASI